MLNKRLQKTLFSGVLAGVMLVTSMQGSWTVGQLDRIKVSRQVSWGGYLNV
ncbi:MAG: hypothetical protein II073_08610 [Lachnospiraceae bacterium]|nr:hypothetical protein [Lachnospiraceae bacterium]